MKKGNRSMVVATIITGVIALVFLLIGFQKGGGEHVAGMKSALTMVVEIMPLLIFAFIIAGMAQVLLPQETVAKWVGADSGMRGILIGTVAGGLTPGGPFVSLPLVAGLMRTGAGVGTLVAFLTGWSLLAISRLPMEVGILGWKLTLIRLASTFFLPPIAGLIAHTLFATPK